LLTAQVNALGKKIVSDLHDSGFKGVVTGTIFNAYFQGTMSKTPLWHNMVGMLCEVASCRIATPLFFPYGSLSDFGPDLPEYKQQSNFLDPWPGGWWRLRDILNIEKTTCYSMLDFVARYHENFIQNFLQLNQENIRLGKVEKPYGYFIAQNQHDPSNLNLMLQKLNLAGVKIQKLDSTLIIGNSHFGPGTYYISCAQPARNYIKDIMEIQNYPELRMYPDGPPLSPYDVTTWNLPLQMDVDITVNKEVKNIYATVLDTITNFSNGRAEGGTGRFIYFSARYNWSISLVLKFLDQGLKVYQLPRIAHFGDKDIAKGSFLIDNQNNSDLMVKELTSRGIDVYLHNESPGDLKKLQAAKIGIYQPYTANIDEGWTRWVLDFYKIPYQVLRNEEIVSGNGLKKVNILIFTGVTAERIVKGLTERSAKDHKIGDYRIRPEFTGGIGKKGVKNLFNFINSGGRLIFLDRSTSFAADSLHLPVQIVNRDMERSKFYIPGALVKLNLDGDHYLTSGMRDCCNVFFSSQTPLFKLMPHTDVIYTPAIFTEHNVITSGWGLGEKLLSNRVALIDIPLGAGNVILYGFRPQHRGQTFGTFKLLFNAFILN